MLETMPDNRRAVRMLGGQAAVSRLLSSLSHAIVPWWSLFIFRDSGSVGGRSDTLQKTEASPEIRAPLKKVPSRADATPPEPTTNHTDRCRVNE